MEEKDLREAKVYIGRKDELNSLTEALIDPDNSIAVIYGFGGIGKTELAKQVVKDLSVLFKDDCWIDGREMTTYGQIVIEMNRMLSRHYKEVNEAELNELNRRNEFEQINRKIVQALQTGEYLIVLDNFETVVDKNSIELKDFLEKIAEQRNSKVILTTRPPIPVYFEQYNLIELKDMEEEEARELISTLWKENSQTPLNGEILDFIYSKLGGHPQSIVLTVPQLIGASPEEIRDNLPKVSSENMQPIFEWTTQKIRNHSSDAERVFYRISVYDEAMTDAEIKAVNENVSNLSNIIRYLQDVRVVNPEDGKYSLHPLTQEYAYEKLKQLGEREKAHQLAAAHHYKMGQESGDIYRVILAAKHLIRAEMPGEAVKKLDEIYLDQQLISLVYNGLVRNRIKELEMVEHQLSEEEKVRLCLIRGIVEHYRMHDYQGSVKDLEQARKYYQRYREIADTDVKIQHISKLAETEAHLGRAYYNICDIEATFRIYEENKRLYEELEKIQGNLSDDQMRQRMHLQLNYGILYRDLRYFPEAQQQFLKNLADLEKIKYEDIEIQTLYNMGRLYQFQGCDNEAKRYVLRALEKAEKPRAIGICYQILSDIECDMGELEKAREHADKAREYYETLKESSGMGYVYRSYGRIFSKKGHYELAASEGFEESIKCFTNKIPYFSLSQVEAIPLAETLLEYAQTLMKQQKIEESLKHKKAARDYYVQLKAHPDFIASIEEDIKTSKPESIL